MVPDPKGHQVTIYDAEPKAGGSLRYTIPEFRLPERALDAELQPLWDAGVRFVGGSEFAGAGDHANLLDAGFDAVVVGSGVPAARPRRCGAERRLSGAELLRQARKGEAVRLAGKVLVTGDGVTAVDAARTALRLGASEVTIATEYQADTMPAGSREVAAALEEGVKFEFGAQVRPRSRGSCRGRRHRDRGDATRRPRRSSRPTGSQAARQRTASSPPAT